MIAKLINKFKSIFNYHQLKVLSFIWKAHAAVLCLSIPPLLALTYLISYIPPDSAFNSLLSKYFTPNLLICFLIAILVISCIHASFLENFTSSKYKIHKPKSFIKKMLFMGACLLISVFVNAGLEPILPSFMYVLFSFYITQIIVYYLLTKIGWFEYKIIV